jgi:hypothetical protein
VLRIQLDVAYFPIRPAPGKRRVEIHNIRLRSARCKERPTQIPTLDQAIPAIKEQLTALALQKAAAQFTANLMKSATIRQ